MRPDCHSVHEPFSISYVLNVERRFHSHWYFPLYLQIITNQFLTCRIVANCSDMLHLRSFYVSTYMIQFHKVQYHKYYLTRPGQRLRRVTHINCVRFFIKRNFWLSWRYNYPHLHDSTWFKCCWECAWWVVPYEWLATAPTNDQSVLNLNKEYAYHSHTCIRTIPHQHDHWVLLCYFVDHFFLFYAMLIVGSWFTYLFNVAPLAPR